MIRCPKCGYEDKAQPVLPKKQRQVHDFYLSYRMQHSMSPTLDEVGQEIGCGRVTVLGHLRELEKKGFFIKSGERGASRGWEPV